MTPAIPVSEQSSKQDPATVAYGLEQGIALALKEEEAGKRSPLIDWLAHHPHLAPDLAAFLAASRDIQSAVMPIRQANANSESGSSIAGLVLGDEIGRGGMGIVYRAHDAKLKRDVAVKCLRCGTLGMDVEWTRFQFEAEAVASLDHPNIVRVHAYGEAGGSPFLVMPLMQGGSLAQRLRGLGPDRCLPPKEAAELIRKIALGIDHAHQRGLLHRDLKPGNILFDDNGQPHIADFGLARRLDSKQSMSVTGSIAGTAAYMAPEQARGEKGLTTAADIHALGAILYELLTGAPPFGTGDLLPTLKRVIEEEATPVRRQRFEVPADLEAICMKCLEKQPGDRYRSAAELADDLKCFLNGEAVAARPPGFWDWLRQMLRTRPHPNYSWQVPIWLGALMLVHCVAIYTSCQLGASAVWVWVASTICAVANIAAFWWYMLRRFRSLPVTERHSLVIGVGHVMAHMALTAAFVPMSFTASAREVLVLYPSIMALSAYAVFILGSTNWSQFLPVGLVLFALVPLMARWPNEAPLIFGILNALLMFYWTFAKRAYFARRPAKAP